MFPARSNEATGDAQPAPVRRTRRMGDNATTSDWDRLLAALRPVLIAHADALAELADAPRLSVDERAIELRLSDLNAAHLAPIARGPSTAGIGTPNGTAGGTRSAALCRPGAP